MLYVRAKYGVTDTMPDGNILIESVWVSPCSLFDARCRTGRPKYSVCIPLAGTQQASIKCNHYQAGIIVTPYVTTSASSEATVAIRVASKCFHRAHGLYIVLFQFTFANDTCSVKQIFRRISESTPISICHSTSHVCMLRNGYCMGHCNVLVPRLSGATRVGDIGIVPKVRVSRLHGSTAKVSDCLFRKQDIASSSKNSCFMNVETNAQPSNSTNKSCCAHLRFCTMPGIALCRCLSEYDRDSN